MALQTTFKFDPNVSYTPVYAVGAVTSDAHLRSQYNRHSVHIINPGAQTVVVQLSNKLEPIEGTDVDWYNFSSSAALSSFAELPPHAWIRFRTSGGSVTAASVYVKSVDRDS